MEWIWDSTLFINYQKFYLMMVMQLNKDGFKDRNTLERGCIGLNTQLMRSETMKLKLDLNVGLCKITKKGKND